MPNPTTSEYWNQTIPAAPSGDQNVVIQSDGATPQQSLTAYPKRMVGDTGSGGKAGAVPPPAAGDAAAGKFMKADGTWAVPPGTGPTTAFSIVEIALAPSSPDNFTVAHGLGVTPTSALIQMTSGGQVWFQTVRFDSTNLYLVASDAGITGKAVVLYAASSALTVAEVALAPSSPNNFTVAHGLGVTPTSAAIQMTSGGEIWFQTPTRFDATNLYLVASDAAITGKAVLFH